MTEAGTQDSMTLPKQGFRSVWIAIYLLVGVPLLVAECVAWTDPVGLVAPRTSGWHAFALAGFCAGALACVLRLQAMGRPRVLAACLLLPIANVVLVLWLATSNARPMKPAVARTLLRSRFFAIVACCCVILGHGVFAAVNLWGLLAAYVLGPCLAGATAVVILGQRRTTTTGECIVVALFSILVSASAVAVYLAPQQTYQVVFGVLVAPVFMHYYVLYLFPLLLLTFFIKWGVDAAIAVQRYRLNPSGIDEDDDR